MRLAPHGPTSAAARAVVDRIGAAPGDPSPAPALSAAAYLAALLPPRPPAARPQAATGRAEDTPQPPRPHAPPTAAPAQAGRPAAGAGAAASPAAAASAPAAAAAPGAPFAAPFVAAAAPGTTACASACAAASAHSALLLRWAGRRAVVSCAALRAWLGSAPEAAGAARAAAPCPDEGLAQAMGAGWAAVQGRAVLRTTGDAAADALRAAVLDLVAERAAPAAADGGGGAAAAALRRADVMARCREKGGAEPGSALYSRVLAQLCVSHAGAWTLRTGDEDA